jgi:hypothetical protein
METCLYEREHQSTLCEYRRFYKHCSCDVTSDVRKTALPKIQGFWVTVIQTSGSNGSILVETETDRRGVLIGK